MTVLLQLPFHACLYALTMAFPWFYPDVAMKYIRRMAFIFSHHLWGIDYMPAGHLKFSDSVLSYVAHGFFKPL